MTDIEQQIKDRISRYESLFNYSGPGKVIGWQEYLEQKAKEMEALEPMTTGDIELDYFVGGFVPGELVVVTGLRGNGKTLFTQTLAWKLGLQGYGFAIFSFEVAPYQYLKVFKDKTGKQLNIYLPEENIPGSLQWLEERIIEAHVKYHINFVVLDHLHFVVDMGSQRLHQEIGVVLRRLVILAKELGIVIFLVCHQKSLPDRKEEPSLDYCRDSSSIPQECSTGIVVHRIKDTTVGGGEADTYDQGKCFVKIDKARRTGTYKKKIYYHKKGDWLVPLLPVEGENDAELI